MFLRGYQIEHSKYEPMKIFSAIIKRLKSYGKLAGSARKKCFSYSSYETLEKLKTRDLLKIVFWMSSYLIVTWAFFVLLNHLVYEPIDFMIQTIALGRDSTHIEGNLEAFIQYARVVDVVSPFTGSITLLVFPICICFRPLRKRRKPIAISIVILLSIYLLPLLFLRPRFHF